MISTRGLSLLPDVDCLRRTLQSISMLDAILCPDWESRYYLFNTAWSTGEPMGSMRNGSGDNFFALFNAFGCWLKGFAHEACSPYRDDGTRSVWSGVYDSVPPEFADCLREPAFVVADATFCIWRRRGDTAWQRGQIQCPPDHGDPDGSEGLLSPLDGEPETYRAWAEDYYEQSLDPNALRAVYDQRPLTADLIALLNPEVSLTDLQADIREIGYPIGGPAGGPA